MRNSCFLTVIGIFLSVTTSAQLTPAHRPPTSRFVPQYLRRPSSQWALVTPEQQALRRATASPEIQWVQCSPEAQALGAMCGTLTVPLDRRHPEGKKIDIYFELYLHTNPGPAESASKNCVVGDSTSTRDLGCPRQRGRQGQSDIIKSTATCDESFAAKPGLHR